VDHTEKIDVSLLSDIMLDYWVAKAEGYETEPFKNGFRLRRDGDVVGFIEEKYTTTLWNYSPSTYWSLGGPIIEREDIWVRSCSSMAPAVAYLNTDPERKFYAQLFNGVSYAAWGPTYLIAAMRCYVAYKFGDKIKNVHTKVTST
jgi:hypothetical protein